MNYFLVDYENVKNDGFEGIDMLDDTNYVFVFYSENSKTLTFDTMEKIHRSNAHIFYQKVMAGTKNALDFQLASYLGYLIGTNGTDNCYNIVTKDMGYKCLIDFWKKEEKKVSLVPNFIPPKSETVVKQTNGNTIDVDEEIQKIIDNYKTKQGINNALVKKFGTTKGGEVYKSIKPLIKDKKGR